MLTEILTNLIVKALAWWYERWKKSRTLAPPAPASDAATKSYVDAHTCTWHSSGACPGCGENLPVASVYKVPQGDFGRPSVGIAQPPEMIPSAFSRLTQEELEDLWHGHRS